MYTWICTVESNCVVSYKSLQCYLDFQHCIVVCSLAEGEDTWNDGSWANSLLLWSRDLGAASLCRCLPCADLVLFVVRCNPIHLLNPAILVCLFAYLFARLAGWISWWIVLMICKFSTRWERGSERSGELVVQLYPVRGHLGGSTVVHIWLFKQCASFNSCQFLGKLQLHFRCIYSTCPNCFPSSKECDLILLFVLFFTKFLLIVCV